MVFRVHVKRHDKEITDANVEYFMQRLSIDNGTLNFNAENLNGEIKAGIRDKRNTYIEIFDNSDNKIYSSPNLNNETLPQENTSFELNGEKVRVKNVPIQIGENTEGYFQIGIAAGDSELLMTILFRVCIVGFFFILALLFVISRIIAQNSIKPIQDIITISNSITHNNLSARIPLPNHKDELYELSDTINKLLDRIESAIEREKSFTSYASHEFRTPLSVLKGTMEVLIRKPRSEEEYKKRITACIKEVDKLNKMVEQLLILTRHEEGKLLLNFDYHPLGSMLHLSLSPYQNYIEEKKLKIKSLIPENLSIYTDEHTMSVILKNLISNAIKYSNNEGLIELKAFQKAKSVVLEISNTGNGIPKDELDKVFEKFYSSYSSSPSITKGFGLGLPIVKRFCSLLEIDIEITSEVDKITTVKLIIPYKK